MKLTIIGASGHGKVVADIALRNGYDEIEFLDDDETRASCGRFAVVGKSERAFSADGDVFVAIGNPVVRERVLDALLDAGRRIPVLIHPDAVVADDVCLGDGTVVMAGAVINPGAEIRKGVIVNTCASVDHDCTVEDYVHIAVGAHLAGTVHVGQRTWIGIGAVVRNNMTVAADTVIGAGAVVVKDILEKGTYVGVPARRIKP